MGFGERLRQLRRDQDLTQSELAQRVGCSVTMIRKIESAERRPSRELTTLLARELGLEARDRADFVRIARAARGTRPTSVPSTLTRLIGRERELSTLRERLLGREVRLLTLCGPPGVGKTRLALELASELQSRFRDGAAFVPLAAARDPDLALETIAEALGLRGITAASLAEAVIDYLGCRAVLLVLDNFEQVLAARSIVVDLLRGAPELKVVVTSREVLAVPGEHVHVVPPLALGVAEVLLLERARAVRPGFGAADDGDVFANICARLEGLPLAIELAATRARVMSPRALLAALDERLAVLDVLRGALDWSFDLLGQHQRRLFAWISVFAGGATLDAIAAVCAETDRPATAVQRDVESLVEKSLLQVSEEAGEVRFTMLETIREYAREQLGNEADAPLQRHAAYFAQLADQASVGLQTGAQLAWLTRLQAEHANLRVALRWALDQPDGEIVGQLCGGLRSFWRVRGYFHEGRRWLATALDLGPAIAPVRRAAMLNAAGELALVQADYAAAASLLDESRQLYASLGDIGGLGHTLSHLGWLAHDRGEFDTARELFEESLRMRREVGDTWGEGWSLNNLGMAALERGELASAREQFGLSAALFRRIGDAVGEAQALSNHGFALQTSGHYEPANELFGDSLALARQLDWRRLIANNLSNLALMAVYRAEYGQARDQFIEALAAFDAVGDRRGIAEVVEGLAGIAGLEGRADEAARLFGVAEGLREELGAPLLPADNGRYDALLAAAREQLDAEQFRQAWAAGRATSVEAAIATFLPQLGPNSSTTVSETSRRHRIPLQR